jgi:large subunit ribosomal protein L30
MAPEKAAAEKAAPGKAAPAKAAPGKAAPAKAAPAKAAPGKIARAKVAAPAAKAPVRKSRAHTSEATIELKQVRSGIGTKPKHRGTLRALGLGRIGRTHVLPDRPEIRGMVARVAHLVEVRTQSEGAAK